MPAAVLLALAIAIEVAATVALRSSDGLTRLVPSAITIAGYIIAFWLLALVLRSIPVSVAYAVWAGVGTAAVAIIGMTLLDEPAGLVKIASIALIIVGVVGLNLSGSPE